MNRTVRMLARIIMPLMAVLTFLMGTGAAYASVDKSMDDFFDNSNAMANATGPSAYQGQQYGYYTFGSLSYRTPTSNVKLGSVKLPSVRAGCGGIDIFGGGFSFINSDQLVSVAKNIASNALGLLFQMAVDSLSELLGTNIKDYLSKLQNMTNRNIDSCEASQALVSSIVEKVGGSTMADCIKAGVNSGKYSDYAAGFAKCGSGGEAESTLASASAGAKANSAIDHNIAWEATRRHPGFVNDKDLSQVMMTLTGTIIINVSSSGVADANGNTGPRVDIVPGEGTSPAIMTALLDGGTLNVLDCVDTACLTLASAKRTITISPANGLRSKVATLLNSIVNKVINRQALTAEEQEFVTSSPLAVYKMASVAVANNKTTAAAEMNKYSDYLATLVAMSWIEQNIQEVRKAAANLPSVDQDSMDRWASSVQSIQTTLVEREHTIEQRLVTTETVLGNFRAMDDDIKGRVSSRFSDSYNFVNGMKRAG